MQVKRRINQFFGNILRKEKTQTEDTDEDEATTSSSAKSRQKGKNNQSYSYSQWDLIEHIAGDAIQDESSQRRKPLEENTIYSDGLAYFPDEILEDFNTEAQLRIDEIKKEKSFLKRSGSLLRRSLRRSKKKSKKGENEGDLEWQGMDQEESLSNVVQEINTTLLTVASFQDENVLHKALEHNAQSDNKNVFTSTFEEINEISIEKDLTVEYDFEEDQKYSQEEGRKGKLKSGLKRQASRLASKFQRNGGSMRLKSTVSVESFPNTSQRKSASFSTNVMAGSPKPGVTTITVHSQAGGLRRKLSFKQAKKVVRKGVSSFGKSMMHASAVMPIAYESPPASFYPDYEDEYPSHLAQCYYRTISYQAKDCNKVSDKKEGHQAQSYCAKPTSFYQHGYCYNG